MKENNSPQTLQEVHVNAPRPTKRGIQYFLRSLKITIIDRYIIGKFLSTFFFTIAIFVVIAVVFDYSEKADDFIRGGVSLKLIFFTYYLTFIPYYCSILSPLIVFVAVIFFTAKMANNTEIVAILSSGVSFIRLMYPYFLASVILAIMVFALNGYIIPPANRIRYDFEARYLRRAEMSKDRNIHMKLANDTYAYMESFNNLENTGLKFSLEKFTGLDMRYKLMANYIKWDSVKSTWKMYDYTIRQINGLQEKMSNGKEKDTILDFSPKDFARNNTFKETMNMSQLHQFIARETDRGTGGVETYQFEMYKRYALPFSTFILSLIGVSLSSKKVRGGVGLHLGIGIGCSFAFIVLIQFSNVFATQGGVPPILAAWIPNLLFGIVGLYLYKIAPK